MLCLLAALISTACQPISQKSSAPGSGSISGTILTPEGAPAVGAYVYAYRDNNKGLRGPADFAASADDEGRYTLDVIQGEYHLIARQRQTGGGSGPPRAGDAWTVYAHNPVSINRTDAGTADFRLQAGTGQHQVRQGSLTSGDTGFSGTLIDAEGVSVEGAFVLAYRSADFRRMPDFTSLPAGADGRFVLYLPDSGRYCLAARTQTRGQPRDGEPYGTLGTDEESCRQVRRGQILDVGTIILRPHHR